MLLLFNNDFESLQHLHQYGKSYRVTASPTTPNNNKKKTTKKQQTTTLNKKRVLNYYSYISLIYRFKTQYRNTFQCL